MSLFDFAEITGLIDRTDMVRDRYFVDGRRPLSDVMPELKAWLSEVQRTEAVIALTNDFTKAERTHVMALIERELLAWRRAGILEKLVVLPEEKGIFIERVKKPRRQENDGQKTRSIPSLVPVPSRS